MQSFPFMTPQHPLTRVQKWRIPFKHARSNNPTFGWTVGVRGPRSGVHSTVYSKVLQERDFGVHSSVELCTPQLWSALQQHAKIEECTTLRWSARQKKSTPMDSTENFVLNRSKKAGQHKRCLIRSPTTLQRRRYDQQMLEPCQRCFSSILGSLPRANLSTRFADRREGLRKQRRATTIFDPSV